MRLLILFAALVAFAACGADGAPEPRDSDLDVSGEVKIGVVGGL